MSWQKDKHSGGKSAAGAWRLRLRWAVWLIFAVSVALRLSALGQVPAPYETNDEFAYLWGGMSLLRGDPPRSWSLLDVPPPYMIGTYNGPQGQVSIVQPWFDHPPVFNIYSGLVGHLAGAQPEQTVLRGSGVETTLWQVNLTRHRVGALVLFAATFWLMWGWLRLAIGPVAALVAVAVLGMTQNFVIHQRLMVADNAVAPAGMLIMFALERWRRGWWTPARTGGVVVAALVGAIGSKMIALALVPAIFAWTSARMRGRAAMRPLAWALAGTGAAVLVILAYAAVYGFDAYRVITAIQSQRFYDLGGLVDAIRHQPVVHVESFDEWMIGAWMLAAAGMMATARAHRAVFAALFGFMAGYIFFVPVDLYGWYLMPVVPFMCAAWGWGWRVAMRRPDATLTLLVLLVLAAAALNPLLHNAPAARGAVRYLYLLAVALVLAPWGVLGDAARGRVIRWMLVLLLLVGLYQQVIGLISMQLHLE